MLTYGDGVGNVRMDELLAFHGSRGRIVTLTAVRPPARFGARSSTATGSGISTRSRRCMRDGSTGVSSSSSRRCCATSRRM